MEFDHIRWEEPEEGIVLVTFDRPDSLNAFNLQTLEEIYEAVERVDRDERHRVLIFTGEGRAFSSGADVEMFHKGEFTGEGQLPLFFRFQNEPDIVPRVEQLSKPVIAALNGVAVGEGLELAIAADFRIASTKAKLGFPEANIGLIPASGGCSRIVKHVGLMRAKELYLGGKILDATEAHRLGLVTELVEPDELLASALILARDLIKKAPLALSLAKITLQAAVDTDVHSGHVLEMLAQTVLMATKDHAEGVDAFLGRRPPKFQGR